MRPRLEPFRTEHLLAFKPRETLDFDRLVHACVRIEGRHPGYTGFVGDEVIGCAGVVILWPGVGEAWSVLTDRVLEHRFWLQRTVKAVIRDIMSGLQLHRLQATVRADSERNVRWIESLGFVREACLSAYDSYRFDYYMYVKRTY